MNTVNWAEKVFIKLIETNNSFALFLVLTILAIIIITGAIVALFYLLVKEMKLRVYDRDALQDRFNKEKTKDTKILSDKNDNLEKKLEDKNEEIQDLIVEQTKYMEQLKYAIQLNTDTIQRNNDLICNLKGGGGCVK